MICGEIDQESLEEALHSFAATDAILAKAIREYGMPKVRRREPGFTGLFAHNSCPANIGASCQCD